MKNVDAMRQFIQSEIEKHKDTYDPDNMRDLVDLYIQAEKNDFKDTKGMNGTISFYQGLTKSVKSEGKDQSVKRNAYFTILAHFVYFSCISDRNLLIL